MKCSACGHEIPDEATFCPECGHKISPAADVTVLNETVLNETIKQEQSEDDTDGLDIPVDEVTSPIPTRFCIHCGAPIPDGCSFCQSCGKPVLEESPAQASSDLTYQQQPYQQAIPSEALENTPASQKKRHTGALIAVIIVVVLVLGCAGVVGAHYFGLLGDPDFLSFLPMQEEPKQAEEDTADKSEDEDEEKDSAPETEMVSIEDLTGLPEKTARSRIASSGLEVGTIEEEYSSKIEEGCVISQSIAAGEVTEGTRVDLVISLGPEPQDEPESGTSTSRYTVVGQAMTWEEAQAWCEDHGGYLATISNREEWQTVQGLMQDSGYEIFWLGAHRNSQSNFVWVDGTSFSFTQFASGEPNNDGGSEDYLAVFDIDGNWAWYDVPNDLDPYYKAENIAFVMEQDA